MNSDQSARDHIVCDLDTSLVVDAGAGTGKTTLLLERMIAILLREKVSLHRIAAITFTDKAAGELIERLRDKLEERLEELPKAGEESRGALIRQALKDLEQASVSTIHSFCSSLLREYPMEAGVDPQFLILDQVQTGVFEEETWDNWLKKSLSEPVECLMDFFELGADFNHVEEMKNHLLRNRSLMTRSKAEPMPEGKPTADLLLQHWKQIQDLRKSGRDGDGLAEELKKRDRDWQGSFELQGRALVLRLALMEIPSAKGPKGGNQKNWDKQSLAQIREHLTSMKQIQEIFALQVKDVALRRVSDWLWNYLETYTRAKAERGFLDFDDLLSKSRDLLKNDTRVREVLKKKFDRLFVDEFQDTDPLQVEIVFFLSEKPKTNSSTWQEVILEPGKLFLVGDPQQSIYRFRRADVEIYEKAKAKLLDSGGKIEKLIENFRTLPSIVQWVNDGFSKLLEKGAFAYTRQSAHRAQVPHPRVLPHLIGLEMASLPPEEQNAQEFRKIEAQTIASFIEKMLNEKMKIMDSSSPSKDSWKMLQAGDIAILLRDISNTEAVYAQALRAKGIPFQIVGGKKFYNRPEIVLLETLLGCLASPADEAGLVALLRSSLFGFTDEQLFLYREEAGFIQFLGTATGKMGKALERLREWYAQTRNLKPAEALLYLYDHTNLLAVAASQPNGEQRVFNLMKMVDQCRGLESSQNFTYRAFVKWLSHQREEEMMEGEAPVPGETRNQVTLMTMHKAKGLEFPVVILSGSGKEKPKPSSFIVHPSDGEAQFKVGDAGLKFWTSDYENARDEEIRQESFEALRLLYVGCTRARESLVLPLFSQEKGGEFLRPIVTQFDLTPLCRMKIDPTPDQDGSTALAVDLSAEDPEKTVIQSRIEFFQKWLEDKKDLIEKRRGKKKIFSVTSMVHHSDDKALRETYLSEGESTSTLDNAKEQGKAFGILSHQLLEKGWGWDKQAIVQAASRWAPTMGLSLEKAEEAARLVSQALENDLLIRSQKASKVFRELPLTGKTGEGIFLNAVIDLAFLEADAWVLVDYKTDKDSPKALESYRKQMGYYRELLRTVTGLKVKEAYLYFLYQNLTMKID